MRCAEARSGRERIAIAASRHQHSSMPIPRTGFRENQPGKCCGITVTLEWRVTTRKSPATPPRQQRASPRDLSFHSGRGTAWTPCLLRRKRPDSSSQWLEARRLGDRLDWGQRAVCECKMAVLHHLVRDSDGQGGGGVFPCFPQSPPACSVLLLMGLLNCGLRLRATRPACPGVPWRAVDGLVQIAALRQARRFAPSQARCQAVRFDRAHCRTGRRAPRTAAYRKNRDVPRVPRRVPRPGRTVTRSKPRADLRPPTRVCRVPRSLHRTVCPGPGASLYQQEVAGERAAAGGSRRRHTAVTVCPPATHYEQHDGDLRGPRGTSGLSRR